MQDCRVGFFEDDGDRAGGCRHAAGDPAGGARGCEDAGIRRRALPARGLEEARELWWEIFGRASRLLLEPLVAGREAEVHPNLLEFLDWTRRDPPLTALRLLEVEIARDVLKTRVLRQMERYPVLLCPVAPMPAFRHGERAWTIEGTQRALPRRLALYGVVQPAAESRRVGARHLVGRAACPSACRSSRARGRR